MEYVVAVVTGYLLGSIPVASIVARRHAVDLHRTGDGNPGAWNALEQLGARRAWPAFAGDGAKALAAGLVGLAIGGWWAAWAGVAAAMAGHAAPVFARGRGGKAVMCFVGGAFVLSPLAAIACVLLGAIVAAVRGFAWGARAGVFAFPLTQLATDPLEHVAGTGLLMTLIGALFVLRRRRPARASDAPAGEPTSSGAAPRADPPAVRASRPDHAGRSCGPAPSPWPTGVPAARRPPGPRDA
jgi:glycerol-3-phosphate acyltransferase PlsY